MGIMSEQKAQGATEYLLLLAGIIVIVAVIGFYLKNLANESGQRTQNLIPNTR